MSTTGKFVARTAEDSEKQKVPDRIVEEKIEVEAGSGYLVSSGSA